MKAWLRQVSHNVAEASKEGGFLGFGGVSQRRREGHARRDRRGAEGVGPILALSLSKGRGTNLRLHSRGAQRTTESSRELDGGFLDGCYLDSRSALRLAGMTFLCLTRLVIPAERSEQRESSRERCPLAIVETDVLQTLSVPRNAMPVFRELLPCVYILANRKHGTLYTGVTSNLPDRVKKSQGSRCAWVCATLWRRPLGPFRVSSNHGARHRTRKTNQEMVSRVEDRTDRSDQSGLAGSIE